MRKERLKRTRQFRGSVMSHQEKVQESVNRAKKRIEQLNRVINERNYPFQGTIQPTLIGEIYQLDKILDMNMVFFQNNKALVVNK